MGVGNITPARPQLGTDLIKLSEARLRLVRPSEDFTKLLKPGRDFLKLVKSTRDFPRLVKPSTARLRLVRPSRAKLGLGRPGEAKLRIIRRVIRVATSHWRRGKLRRVFRSHAFIFRWNIAADFQLARIWFSSLTLYTRSDRFDRQLKKCAVTEINLNLDFKQWIQRLSQSTSALA